MEAKAQSTTTIFVSAADRAEADAALRARGQGSPGGGGGVGAGGGADGHGALGHGGVAAAADGDISVAAEDGWLLGEAAAATAKLDADCRFVTADALVVDAGSRANKPPGRKVPGALQ